MPNVLLTPATTCKALRRDGAPCQSPHLSGRDYCLFHTQGMPKRTAQLRAVDPSDSMNVLMRLDPTVPDNMQRIRIGLMQHVAAGTIEHQAATACLRFAQAAFDAAPRSRADAVKSVVSAVIASAPHQDDE